VAIGMQNGKFIPRGTQTKDDRARKNQNPSLLEIRK
jgi:hypothetical protein